MATKKGNYAFIDNQNLNLGVQKLGSKMDWKRFPQYLADTYGVTKAFMFIGHMPEHEDMYLKMHELGYLVVLKPTFDMTRMPRVEVSNDEKQDDKVEEKKVIKGNVDAELVLWAVKEMKHYDKALVVSGDGDFFCLVEYLVKEGKLLHLLAPNGQYSNLYNSYEAYIERVDKQRKILAYKHFSKNKKKPSNS